MSIQIQMSSNRPDDIQGLVMFGPKRVGVISSQVFDNLISISVDFTHYEMVTQIVMDSEWNDHKVRVQSLKELVYQSCREYSDFMEKMKNCYFSGN